MVFHMGRSLCSPSRLSISVVHCVYVGGGKKGEFREWTIRENVFGLCLVVF